jgi:hypothetical protein
MDSNLIYLKTSAGEDAIQQRTRVIQRNVRMVLILVDGQSTVGDLCRKTGNPQLTENALAELEKGGFITAKVEQHDSLWQESQRVAQVIRAAAQEKAEQFLSREKSGGYPDFQPSRPVASTERAAQASDMPISLHSIFDATPSAIDFSSSQFSLAPDNPEIQKAAAQLPEMAVSEPASGSDRRVKKPQRATKPSFFSQIRSLWAGGKHELDEEPIRLKPVRRGVRTRITWPVGVLLSIVGTLGIVFVASLLFPFSIFLSDVEAAFARSVGRPVSVGALRVEFYPAQGLILERVRIGAGDGETDELSVREIRLLPEVATLFAERLNFKRAVLSDLSLPLGAVIGLPGMFSSLAGPSSRVDVEQIRFEKATISFDGIVLKNVESEVLRDQGGRFESLLIRSADGSLSVVARPVGKALDLDVEAYAWQPFENARIVFGSASMKARLENGELAISGADLRVFDGVVKGSALIRSGEKPNIEGEIGFERVNAIRLFEALGAGKRLEGDIAGKVRFSARSDAWETLLASVDAEGEFSVQRGKVAGVDLVEAVRRVSGAPVQGGVTAFEQLTGRMKLEPDRSRFFGLVMSSGLMQSTGQVSISKAGNLNGRLELQMQGSVNQTRVPVSIAGTLASPSAQATN